MDRHSSAFLLAAALIVAGALPPSTPAQTVSAAGVDVHAFGLSPADVGFGGTDAFGLPPVFGGSPYGSAFAGPGRYTTCGGSSSAFLFMFGSAPGRFNYGWYSSPWDASFSGNWLSPWPAAYGFWAHHYGFGYGSRVGSYGWNPWSPWSSYRSYCGRRFGYGFSYWGAGGGYYPGSWRSFAPAGPPRYVNRGPSPAKPSVSADGVRPGIRVIESRPETGGADLRRVDPRRRAVALEDLAKSPPAGSQARGRANDDLPPGETITDAINRSRARTAPRRTEVVKIPLNPVDPRLEGPRRAGSATTGPGERPPPRATQPRSRPAPRAMPRPTRSTQPRPEARRAPPPANPKDSKGRTRQ